MDKFMESLHTTAESVGLPALHAHLSYETLRPCYQLADCAVQASDIPAKQRLRACLWLPVCSQGLPMRVVAVIPR